MNKDKAIRNRNNMKISKIWETIIIRTECDIVTVSIELYV